MLNSYVVSRRVSFRQEHNCPRSPPSHSGHPCLGLGKTLGQGTPIFCFFFHSGLSSVVYWILPKNLPERVSANRLPEYEKLSRKSSEVINPANSTRPYFCFSNQLHPRTIILPKYRCVSLHFPNHDKPAFSVFFTRYSLILLECRAFRNLLRFLGKSVEVV